METLAFHRKVREGFLDIARNDPGRVVVVDANRAIRVIQDDIRKIVALEKVAGIVHAQRRKDVLTQGLLVWRPAGQRSPCHLRVGIGANAAVSETGAGLVAERMISPPLPGPGVG